MLTILAGVSINTTYQDKLAVVTPHAMYSILSALQIREGHDMHASILAESLRIEQKPKDIGPSFKPSHVC